MRRRPKKDVDDLTKEAANAAGTVAEGLSSLSRKTSEVYTAALADKQQMTKVIVGGCDTIAENYPKYASYMPYAKKAAPAMAQVYVVLWHVVLPFYAKLAGIIIYVYQVLPTDLIAAIFGLGLCLFGGVFPMSIAAAEAFLMCGWANTYKCLQEIYSDLERIRQAEMADGKKDDDGDGVVDVKALDAKQLLHRKVTLYLTTCNPDKLSNALAGVYTAWLGVIATLKIQFARTIALGNSIGKVCVPVSLKYGVPALEAVMPEKYHNWTQVIIRYVVKSICISIAYAIQRVISAVYSAIRGGQLTIKYAIRYLNKTGVWQIPEDSNLPDIFGAALATFGVIFQLSHWFELPFPFNIILLPLRFVEWFIWWSVSSSN